MAGVYFNEFGPVHADGVVFRVGENYIPPAEVTLPQNFQSGISSDVLFMEYDFSKEEKFISWRETWLAEKTLERKQRLERIQKKQEEVLKAQEEELEKKEEETERARLQAVEQQNDVKADEQVSHKQTVESPNMDENTENTQHGEISSDTDTQLSQAEQGTVKFQPVELYPSTCGATYQQGSAQYHQTSAPGSTQYHQTSAQGGTQYHHTSTPGGTQYHHTSAPGGTQYHQTSVPENTQYHQTSAPGGTQYHQAAPGGTRQYHQTSVPQASLYANLGQNMLVPTPVSNSISTAPAPAEIPSLAAKFNPADFEKVEDPFNELELRTINDMEELNKVLQSVQYSTDSTAQCTITSTDNVQEKSRPQTTVAYSNNLSSVQPCKNCGIVHSGYCSAYAQIFHRQSAHGYRPYLPSQTGVRGGYSVKTETAQSNYDPNIMLHHGNNNNSERVPSMTGQFPTSFNMNSSQSPVSCINNIHSTQNGQPVFASTCPPSNPYNSTLEPSSNSTFPHQSYSHMDMSPNGQYKLRKSHTTVLRSSDDRELEGRKSLDNSRCTTPVNTHSEVTLRSARSEPDLTACCQSSSTNERFHNNGTNDKAVSKQNNINPQDFSDIHTKVKTLQKITNGIGEQDSYSLLSSSDRHTANRIIGMGFERNSAARAVQKYGSNEKQVVDFLCSINRLCEKGVKKEEAEAAMLVTGDIKQATQYLLLLRRFKEFGFSQQKVHEGLLRHDMDEEKTLDWLTCS